MKELYLGFLDSLRKNKFITGWKTVRYTGPALSFNKLYAASHWRGRANLANKYHGIFKTLLLRDLGKPPKKTAPFSIFICYNYRLDPDNTVAFEKFFVDTLVNAGYVEDDNSTFYKSLMIVFDPSLPKKTIDFHVITHSHKQGQ